MNRNTITCFGFLAVVSVASASEHALEDLHLPVIPRTAEEAKRIERVVAPTSDFTVSEKFEVNQAGGTTVRPMNNSNAFSQSSANISFERELDFKVGNGLFKKLWVSSPSSTLASDGLGPLYNARSCQRCHLKDGRGHPPEGPKDGAVSMLVRVSVPGGPQMDEIEDYIATQPEPVYGGQIQDFSVAGHAAEADLSINYTEKVIELSGGEQATLREPVYSLTNLGYGELHRDVMLSARVAPQMIGLGLLEAIPAQDILALADPDDRDGDGISGRPQIVMSQVHGVPMLGRFGLKAGQPSIWEQSASAFQGDIGVSTTVHRSGYGDCTERQQACRTAPHGNTEIHDGVEIGDEGLRLVAFYSSNLAVPARRGVDDPQVLKGKRVFYETGCTSCHTPKFVTHRLAAEPEQSFQLIWPYTDMLLHDMGPGLADNRPEGRANGFEWRTPPLWGIGMTETVSGHTYFLHDGRARSLLEAVLWHGGEAARHKQRVIEMPPEDRAALINFLESL
ncbi:MAG: di-heme oxidoredictase family protein [Pseudomonadota bacterium]